MSSALGHFHQKLDTAHAFEVVIDMDSIEADCFARNDPTIAPARTFLSQLM